MGNCSVTLDTSTCHALGTALAGVIPSQAELKAEEKYLQILQISAEAFWMDGAAPAPFPPAKEPLDTPLQKEQFFP